MHDHHARRLGLILGMILLLIGAGGLTAVNLAVPDLARDAGSVTR